MAYTRLLEFLVADHLPVLIHQFDDKFGWLLKDEALYKSLVNTYKQHFDAIHADRYDYLGDLYVELQGRFSQSIKGQFLTPQHITDMMAKMLISDNEKDKSIRILDPCVGTGRMLISAAHYAPNATCYGIDIDNRAIRTALANACIHKTRMFLLNADSLRHATDMRSEAGQHNWHYANHWQSHYGELKTLADEFRDLQDKGVVPKKTGIDQYKKQKAEQLSLFEYVK